MPLTTKPPRLYYEQRGTGDPLLWITGFGASSAVLEPLADRWSARFQCITYDHPGTGRSSRRACPLTTAQLAKSAIDVLDELGIDAAHIAGLSLGGAVAQELAIRFPGRVRGLILISTSTSGPLSIPPDPRTLLAATRLIWTESVRRRNVWLAPAMFADGFAEREAEQARALTQLVLVHPPSAWALAGQYVAACLHDRALDLHRIRAPTLVLHGADDILVPATNGRKLADGIADAELHEFPRAGHMLLYEHPDATFRVVREWLDRRAPGAPQVSSAHAERVTRALSVPLGALRVTRSSVALLRRL
jgi:pimeloyl-ACP methyl ester carboxylesterase